MAEQLPKIREARRFIDALGSDIDIEVDGGITEHNVKDVVDAGVIKSRSPCFLHNSCTARLPSEQAHAGFSLFVRLFSFWSMCQRSEAL